MKKSGAKETTSQRTRWRRKKKDFSEVRSLGFKCIDLWASRYMTDVNYTHTHTYTLTHKYINTMPRTTRCHVSYYSSDYVRWKRSTIESKKMRHRRKYENDEVETEKKKKKKHAAKNRNAYYVKIWMFSIHICSVCSLIAYFFNITCLFSLFGYKIFHALQKVFKKKEEKMNRKSYFGTQLDEFVLISIPTNRRVSFECELKKDDLSLSLCVAFDHRWNSVGSIIWKSLSK